MNNTMKMTRLSSAAHRDDRRRSSSTSNNNYLLLCSLFLAFVLLPSAVRPFPLIVHASIPTTTLTTPTTTTTTALHSTAASSSGSNIADIKKKSKQKRNWKDGEYKTTLPSKLLFKYVNPLLDIASKRQLVTEDAFHVPPERLMSRAVTRLEDAYTKCREKAKLKLGNKKQKILNNDDKNNKQPSTISESTILAKALLQSQKSTLIQTAILRLLNTIIQAFPSILIARLLRQIEASNTLHYSEPLKSALILIGVLSTKMVIENQYFHEVVKCACEVRGSIAGMIFDKSLRLSSSSLNVDDGMMNKSSGDKKKKKKAQTTLGSGGVLNLMQSDATIIELLTLQIHTLWDGLLQIAIYSALLYKYLGPPFIWGVSVLLTTIPINAIILRQLNKLNQQELKAKDARMKKTTESVANMQLLKLQSWEDIFASDVQSHREEELKRHTKRGAVRAINQAISNAVPTITLVVTLAAYARTGKPIVASTIFTAISLFNQLRFPLFFYPMLIDSMANGRNSLRRISSYMAQEEIRKYVEYMPKSNDGGGSIELTSGNFAWSTGSSSSVEEDNELVSQGTQQGVPALRNASISVRPGEIVAVVGEVGRGKSALVKALIGELVPVPTIPNDTQTEMPQVVARGSIAYCAQEAWLPKGTIRESVVFDREYDEEKYLRAICAAGLDKDIVSDGMSAQTAEAKGLLTHETDVGEDGSNLSGGQRARVALARALYDEDAGVYILDDPLSALDASVGSTVFERVSQKLKRQKAATVFVTNDPNLPRRCDRVILMGQSSGGNGSQILDIGTYDELLRRGHNLSTIGHHREDDVDQAGDEMYAEEVNGSTDTVWHQLPASTENVTASDCHADPDCRTALKEDPALLGEHVVPKSIEPIQDNISKTTDKVQQKELSTDETMSTSAVPRSTYVKYFKSVKSPLLVAAALSAYFISNGSQFFQQLIVAKWTEAGKGGMIEAAVSAKYLNKLVLAAVMVSVSMYFRSYLTMRVGMRASKTLHQEMLKSVFKAPLSFFSRTPSGQLLNRFGRELEIVDRSLPDGIASVLYCFLQIFFSTIALAGVVTPGMLVPLTLVGILYVKTMAKFRPAARDLKRCESKSRSPIYTHFREAIRGAETIRSIPSGRSLWSRKHRTLADENISVYYSVKSLDRWLSIRLESLGNTVVLTAAMASIFLTRAGRLKAGSAGWGLTQALSITGLLTWAVRVLTDLETQFMSVMRVNELTNLEYTDVKDVSVTEETNPLLPNEYSHHAVVEAPSTLEIPNETNLLNSGWPWSGHVKFNNVSMRYNALSPLVLKNVTIDIPAGTTLGVVGRTGSGKSSLLLTLFRLVEVEGAGSITIDGVDIRSLSVKGLRDSLSIIPQAPTLFAGTLLYNLDASGKATAEEAWSALEAASPELAKQFRNSESGLESLISEGGENLSLGQRQLICLARALIRRSKILVLDEATSSVDTKTDAQVQETIRREFVQKGVTVITVAHRLDTVLGYDKILVLDAGEPVEIGPPDELLKLPGGYLRRLFDADRRNRQKGRLVRAM